MVACFFFFNDTATTEIYTLSLHDALPISPAWEAQPRGHSARTPLERAGPALAPHSRNPPAAGGDRKSTRLNSSHLVISYAVFCLKKKKTQQHTERQTTTNRSGTSYRVSKD